MVSQGEYVIFCVDPYDDLYNFEESKCNAWMNKKLASLVELSLVHMCYPHLKMSSYPTRNNNYTL